MCCMMCSFPVHFQHRSGINRYFALSERALRTLPLSDLSWILGLWFGCGILNYVVPRQHKTPTISHGRKRKAGTENTITGTENTRGH